jgi:hypothetical protein
MGGEAAQHRAANAAEFMFNHRATESTESTEK